MQFPHPFGWLRSETWNKAFILITVLTLVVMAALQWLGGPLRTAVAPQGIVSFEFAGSLAAARAMIDSWGPTGQIYAGLNLGLDYLFMPLYAGAIALGCLLVARGSFSGYRALVLTGVLLAWGQIIAALLDCVENIALINLLLGANIEMWTLLARWTATPKFVLVAVGLVYVLMGAVVALIQRFR